MSRKFTPNLWFDGNAEEAADFYCSVFPNSHVVGKSHYTESSPGETGAVMTVDFELDGQRFTGINGGPQFKFSEAISFLINCSDQEEVDHYWDKLVEGGGETGPCGWLKDRFGVSWQVVPEGMEEVFAEGDEERTDRVMKAMLQMTKLDVAELRRAADGETANA